MGIAVIFVLLLVSGSVFVNGWTDAPNAIATVVSTRVLRPRVAVAMAAVFNLLGVMISGSAVANVMALGSRAFARTASSNHRWNCATGWGSTCDSSNSACS